MATIAAEYKVIIKLDGEEIGDIREIAEGLHWSRYRTCYGTDSINFNVNDKLLADWCGEHGRTVEEILRPIAITATIVRNGEEVAGGFLASMPAYNPNQASATLAMRFDGYMNLLAGVYEGPTAKTTDTADNFVRRWLSHAQYKSADAGKSLGLSVASDSETLRTIERTYDSWATIKERITQMADNTDGAGNFEVIIDPAKKVHIKKEIGRTITDRRYYYPARDFGQSIATIQADEVTGFASYIIAIGAGETSSDPAKNTAKNAQPYDSNAVKKYGYCERLVTHSSVTTQATLTSHAQADLANAIDIRWRPRITLLGISTPPSPTAEDGLWIGDRIQIENTADVTGQTSGWFRVNAIEVAITPTGAETITPSLERIDATGTRKDQTLAGVLKKLQQSQVEGKTAA